MKAPCGIDAAWGYSIQSVRERILAVLESQLADLTFGMRPEFVEKAKGRNHENDY